jgi:hypothetical protein
MKPVYKFILGFAAILLLQLGYGYLTTGRVSLTRKSMNFRVMQRDDWRANEARRQVASFKGDRPASVLASTLRNYPANLLDESVLAVKYIGTIIVTLGMAGIILRRKILLCWLLPFLIFPLFTGLGFVERFVLPYAPILIIGMIWLEGTVYRTLEIFVVVVAALQVGLWADIAKYDPDPWPELKAVGQYLNGKLPASAVILDRKPYVTFYSGLRSDHMRGMLNDPLPVILQDGRTHATHMVVSRRMASIFRPQILPMLDPKQWQGMSGIVVPRLQFFKGEPYEVLLFEFVKQEGSK